MSRKSLFKTVVIGLGRIGMTLEGEPCRARPCTHTGSVSAHESTVLTGGFDLDSERCKDFSNRFPKAVSASDNLSDFLKHTMPDIVVVAVSSSSHLEVMQTIIAHHHKERNLKGILLEKPVGINYEEGKAIESLLKNTKIHCVVCHDRRFYPKFQEILKFGKQKRKLGKLKHLRGAVHCASYVRGRGNISKNFFFGGPLVHDGTHLLDLMFFFAGKPSHVTGLCIREKNNQYTEDTSMGHLFFADGVQGSFLAGGKRKYFHFELELEWERARLYCGNHIRFEIKNPENPFLIQQPFIKLKQENPYLIRLTHLIDLVSGKETVNQSSLEDGLATLKVIDAIYRSSANGGVITAVEENSILPDTLMLKH